MTDRHKDRAAKAEAKGPEVDPRRRALLKRLGLAAPIAYLAPALSMIGTARASGGSGGSGGSSRASLPSGRRAPRSRETTRQPARQPASQTVRAAATRPEMVALLPDGIAPEALAAAGYPVLARIGAPHAGGTLLRLGLPPGRTVGVAQAELATLFPGTLSDANALYAPENFLCGPEGCAAQEMIGWTGWPSALAPKIGMIDTGINTTHDALAGQRLTVQQADLAERAVAGRQHGTAVAAMLVGRLDSRVPGLLPFAELHAVEAFHATPQGDRADAFALAQAVDLLIGAGVSVINLSLSGPDNAVLRRMVEIAHAEGVALVAAAGNGGPGAAPAFPAAWPEVIAVTAVDRQERAWRQANQGPYIQFAAPGVNLWTAASVSGGRLRSGTSYAAPFVTASLAVSRLRDPDAPIADVVETLIGCARDLGEAGFDPVFGHGLIQSPAQCEAETFLTSGD
ncbi:MAG: S8 family serine peptidase [Pseudorhodobacter sp.]